MSDIILSYDQVQTLATSPEKFPVDFETAWQAMGYTLKENALKVLKKTWSFRQL